MINLESISKYNALGSRLTSYSGVAAPTLAAVLELSEKIDRNAHPTFYFFWDILNDASLWLYIFFLIIFLLGKFYSRKGDRVIWEVLQTQVDKLQAIAFQNHAGGLNDHHRVTLFKYKQWCWTRFFQVSNFKWPRQGWLIPVIRSGHTGKNTKTVFCAPDSGQHAEGIVGFCWSSDAITVEQALPKITDASSNLNKQKYCSRSHMPRWMLDNYCGETKVLARDILAFPVKTSTGNRWGVLVYDSMQSDSINVADAQRSFEVVIESIGVLVEGV